MRYLLELLVLLRQYGHCLVQLYILVLKTLQLSFEPCMPLLGSTNLPLSFDLVELVDGIGIVVLQLLVVGHILT